MTEVRSTSKTLKLVFSLENGNTSTVNLKDPKDNLTMTQISDVAETMVTKEFFIVGGSPIAVLKDTYIETVTKEEIAA